MHQFSKVKLSDEFVVNMKTVLGKGSTGCVYQGIDLRNNTKVAVKVIELCTIDNQVTQYLLKMEKIAIMELSSPYVLKGLRILQDQKYCFMVTQFCNGGTLKKYIQNNKCLSQQKSLKIVKSLLQGYQNLVDKKVLHRDLKPANIMMHDQNPKIIDFGYCQIQGYRKPNLQYNVGSPSYMAPQSYQRNIYNQKTEIWALGVILFECLTGKTLDQGHEMSSIYRQIENHGILYPDHVSQKARNIINKCLCINPKNRSTCLQLLEQFFTQNNQKVDFMKKNQNISQKTIPTQPSTKNFFESQKTIQLLNLQTLQKKNILLTQRSTQKQMQTRTLFGVLTTPQQQTMGKYMDNKTRPTFSFHQKPQNYQQIQHPENNQKYFNIKNQKQLQFIRKHSYTIQNSPNYSNNRQNIRQNISYNSDYYGKNIKPYIEHQDLIRTTTIYPQTSLYQTMPTTPNRPISHITTKNYNGDQTLIQNPVLLIQNHNQKNIQMIKNSNIKHNMIGFNAYTDRQRILSYRV